MGRNINHNKYAARYQQFLRKNEMFNERGLYNKIISLIKTINGRPSNPENNDIVGDFERLDY